jgi:hypothetical protein
VVERSQADLLTERVHEHGVLRVQLVECESRGLIPPRLDRPQLMAGALPEELVRSEALADLQ